MSLDLASAPAMPTNVAIVPTSHLDLFWLGDYRTCLERGDEIIRAYLDRCIESGDETFVIDTTIFAEHFLDHHPEYEGVVRQLLDEGRLEIGTAYIDRWENLVLGESLIRNVQIGQRWNRERLGLASRLAAHPDLPGYNAQTSQIYARAGVRYYVTSRKIFHEGRVWRHRAPDGTGLVVLTWPVHYVFLPMEPDHVPETRYRNFSQGLAFSRVDLASRYPAGTAAISGSAGDLTGPSDFVDRYGHDLRHYVERYREEYPETTWTYSIPARLLAPYLEDEGVPLVETAGSIPSVWGVAADEEMRFFHRCREVEHLLLSAETAGVLARLRGRAALPEAASAWQGLYSENAFFGADDRPPSGREWEWLWRMHVFTQDHNGGGQDGTLSTFQKRVRQDRVVAYANQVFGHALEADAGDTAVQVLRTRLGTSETLLVVDGDTASAVLDSGAPQLADSSQTVEGADGSPRLALALKPLRGVGCGPLLLADRGVPRVATVDSTSQALTVATDRLRLTISSTGAVSLTDLARGQTWNGIAGPLRAVPELGNDTAPVLDAEAARTAVQAEARVVGMGPLCTQVRLDQVLLGVPWTTLITVWHDEPRVDLDVRVQWPALEDWQIVMPLVRSVPRQRIVHGTPFHGSAWDQVPEGASAGRVLQDELRTDDYDRYREVQHWIHLRDDDAGLTVATRHPAFAHDGSDLAAVLLRTPVSCGDNRLHWTNPGVTDWHFEIVLGEADWADAGAAERGDIAWRRPIIQAQSTPDVIELLTNQGDPVQLSALIPGANGETVVRLVNQSAMPVEARLTGAVVAEVAELIDLADEVTATRTSLGGELPVFMGPWEIQTIRLLPRGAAGRPGPTIE